MLHAVNRVDQHDPQSFASSTAPNALEIFGRPERSRRRALLWAFVAGLVVGNITTYAALVAWGLL